MTPFMKDAEKHARDANSLFVVKFVAVAWLLWMAEILLS